MVAFVGALGEAIPARATSLSVRVVDSKALLLDGVLEINGGPVKIGRAHFVDYQLDT